MPRIETEFWVHKALKEIKNTENTSRCIKVLDVFAGSGCIGIAVLKHIKNSKVDFADINQKAVEQIKINLELNKIAKDRHKVYRSNLFEKLKGNRYNFIFANPPYVAKDRIKEVQPSVLKYEPRQALFSGRKGLDYIKKFLKEAKKHLKDNGTIYLELDSRQKEEIKKILERENYKKFRFFKDQFDQWRLLKVEAS